MSRPETVGYLKSRVDSNTIGYGANLATYRLNTKLPDNIFIAADPHEYARKTAKILLFSNGYNINAPTETDPQKQDFETVIRTENDCARFIPICDPTTGEQSSVTTAYPNLSGNAQEYYFTQTGINLNPNASNPRYFENYRCKYMYGDDLTDFGAGCAKIAPVSKWTVKQWVVLPMLVGVYVGAKLGQDVEVMCANGIDLDTYFADPSQYPMTVTGYSNSSLIGFTYTFVIVGNLADNKQGYGRAQMCDCGYEMKQSGDLIVGGYGEETIVGLPTYSNFNVMDIAPIGISTRTSNIRVLRALSANNTLLGIAPGFSSGFANSYKNLQGGNYATPFFTLHQYRANDNRRDMGTSRGFEVIGDEQFLSWTNNKYGIGRAGDNARVESKIPYISYSYINKDFLIKVACQLGMPILTNWADAENFESAPNIVDWYEQNGDKIVIPPLDVTTGFITDNPPKKYSELDDDDPIRKYLDSDDPLTEVEPPDTSDIDKNKYTEETPLNIPSITAVGAFNKYYAISQDDVESLCNFLYTNNQSAITNILDGLKLNGENPMNFLISLKMFPFDIGEYGDITAATIGFGNGVDTGIVAEKLNNFSAILDLGTCTFREYNKNFYDYEPYTHAKLYIPYCGEVSISTAQFVGHAINVKMIVDIITGACCAVVFCDGVAVDYSNGNLAVEIPITGENATEYVSRGMTDISKSIGSVMGLANGGGVNSFLQGLEAGYDFNHMPTPLQTNGTSTAQTNFYKPQKCYFIVQSPILLPTLAYKSQVGYACEVTRKLNDLQGFTVCGNVTNITPARATEQEINEIKQLLESGVYL